NGGPARVREAGAARARAGERLKDRHVGLEAAPGPPLERARTRWLDVLVQPEEIGRVVAILERDEAPVGIAPVGLANALTRLLEKVVGVRAPRQEGLQAGKALARPPHVIAVSGRVGPLRVDEQIVLGSHEVQRAASRSPPMQPAMQA